MTGRTALITGVGPGTGSALARRFAEGGYAVALLARTAERIEALAAELGGGARAYPCDVSDGAAVAAAVQAVTRDLRAPEVVVHNAVGGGFGSFLDIEPALLERTFAVNVMGLLHLARATVPAMIERGAGALVATGNTAAFRGRPNFAGFAPTKAAQRILLESIGREVGPKGVHAAYVAIDAVIDMAWTRERWPDRPDDFFIRPQSIAEEVFRVAHQPRDAWSFNVELRPYAEPW